LTEASLASVHSLSEAMSVPNVIDDLLLRGSTPRRQFMLNIASVFGLCFL
jgi:hypothetical protein